MDAVKSQPRVETRSASQFCGKKVHFIGIGGCGMSGLARMLLDAGAIVTGSDPHPNEQTFELVKRGAKVSRDQMGELLNPGMDLVVRTAAVPDNNAEVMAAAVWGLRVVKYAQMLGLVMQERLGVAVAGMHGKSTTSAMISYALLRCGADPSFVFGGTARQLSGGSRSGRGRIFVAEACEYDRSFHNLHPTVALITNIEKEHMDCYKDIQDIVQSYHDFAKLVPADGLIVANGVDARVKEAMAGIVAPIHWVALREGFDWSAREIEINNGCWSGEVCRKGSGVGRLMLSVAGEHNLLNATMAVAACAACGVASKAVIEALNDFAGVDRRMAFVGRHNGALVIDDYGHHPTEIRATLKALRERDNPKRLICVFQPHQHSRTRMLLDDFADSFKLADETIVPEIYFVRDSESERKRISASDLVQCIRQRGQKAKHLAVFRDIVDYLKVQAHEGDLFVTMGAGNVWEIGKEVVD